MSVLPQPELAHEHNLHRLVAGSAFLFALCALPIAQYAFFHKSAPEGDQGQVAGVSTERAAAAVAAPLTCSEQRIQLVDIDDLARQKNLALDREVAEATQPYTDAIALLQPGESYEAEKAAIETIIASTKVPFENRRVQWQAGLATERAKIAGQECLAE